jgi:hypothetical protein
MGPTASVEVPLVRRIRVQWISPPALCWRIGRIDQDTYWPGQEGVRSGSHFTGTFVLPLRIVGHHSSFPSPTHRDPGLARPSLGWGPWVRSFSWPMTGEDPGLSGLNGRRPWVHHGRLDVKLEVGSFRFLAERISEDEWGSSIGLRQAPCRDQGQRRLGGSAPGFGAARAAFCSRRTSFGSRRRVTRRGPADLVGATRSVHCVPSK